MLEGGDLEDDKRNSIKCIKEVEKKKIWKINEVVSWLKTLAGIAPNISMGYSHLNQKNADGDDETASNASSQASSIASSTYSAGESIASMAPDKKSDAPIIRDAAAEIERSQTGSLKLTKLVQKLNDRLLKAQKNEIDKTDGIHKLKELSPETANWIIRTCHSDIKWDGYHHLAHFIKEARKREREKKGTPALWFRGVAEISSMACGQCKNWFYLAKTEDGTEWQEKEDFFAISKPQFFYNEELGYNDPYDVYPGPSGKKWPKRRENSVEKVNGETKQNEDQDLGGFSDDDDDDDERTDNEFDSGTLLDDFGFADAEQRRIGPLFVTLLATGDASVWYLANGDGIISSKILSDTRIIAAFCGLAAQDRQIIDLNLKALCALIGTDTDACGALIRLAMGDYKRLNVEIDKLTRRIGAGVTKDLALGFCAGCTLVPNQIAELLTPLCSGLDLDPKGNGDGLKLASCIVLAAQCKGEVSREAWRQLVETAIKMQTNNGDDDDVEDDEAANETEMFDTTISTEEWLKNNPANLWITNAIAAMLAHDSTKIRFYAPKLDAYFGMSKVWSALSEGAKKKIANPTGIKFTRKSQKKKNNKNENENDDDDDDDDDENTELLSCTSLLYAIATNDMSKLDGVLQILTPIAIHADSPPKRGKEELVEEQIATEKRARENTMRFVKIFNRQASPEDINLLEELCKNKTGLPDGAFTAISASLNGDLDQFAHGIDAVTTTCIDPVTGKPMYTDIRGLPALLVSLVRSDGNADMHVFARVLHLLGRPSANKRMANLVTEIVASNGSIMDQMNITMKSWKSKIQGIIKGGSLKVLAERIKFDALIEFIYGALVGGAEGRKRVIQSVKVFGFNEHLAVDIMALAGGGPTNYIGIVKDPVDPTDCFILPQDLERLTDSMDGVKTFCIQTKIHKDVDQKQFKSGNQQLHGHSLKHIRNTYNIPTDIPNDTVCFVQKDNPYDVFECLTEILTLKFQKHILSNNSKSDLSQLLVKRLHAKITMSHMLNIVSCGYGAMGTGRKGVSTSLHTVAKHTSELIISKVPSKKRWWNWPLRKNETDFRKNPYRKPDDLDLLDGIYLSQADAPSHNELLVNCIRTLLDLLEIGSTNEKVSTHENGSTKDKSSANTLNALLAGIMCLISPTNSQEMEEVATALAKKDLSAALSDENMKVSPDIIGFCMGLARVDMDLVENMGKQVGEFDSNVVSDILILISRLAPIIKSVSSAVENFGQDDDGTSKKNSSSEDNGDKTTDTSVKNSGGGGGGGDAQDTNSVNLSAEIIFRACVAKSGDTLMAFDEFATACKVLNLNYHEQALYELFLLGDQMGTGLITVTQFAVLLERMMMDVSSRVMIIRGQTKSGMLIKLCTAIVTLVALIVFLLLGVETFSLSGGFAAGVSSTLFGGIGKLMDSLGEEEVEGPEMEGPEEEEKDEEEEGDNGGGDAGANIQAALHQAISIYNVDD